MFDTMISTVVFTALYSFWDSLLIVSHDFGLSLDEEDKLSYLL